MKVIWIVNVVLPEAAEALGEKAVVSVTWLETVSKIIRQHVELVVCCPITGSEKIIKADGDKITFYGIPRKKKNGNQHEKRMKGFYHEVYKNESPDVIHIWGTEFPHTLSAVEAAEDAWLLENVIISIQGLVSIYARHFMADVPFWLRYLMVPKNFLKGYNLYLTKRSYEKRGKYETEALKKAKHVIGRTDWDNACTSQIHPKIHYYKNNETLRQVFYENKWSYNNCIPHRIFMSQGGSPLKGMHYALEAVKIVKRKYPDVHLYITGRNVVGRLSMIQGLSLNSYDWYIRREIKRNKLEENVTFLGELNGEEMCSQYLKANAFILPSAIENSPNSLGEAMLLGVPSVAADVGGVHSLTTQDEVYLYPHDEPYMLAFYLEKIFENSEQIKPMSEKARNRARETHDADKNIDELIEIYTEIAQ